MTEINTGKDPIFVGEELAVAFSGSQSGRGVDVGYVHDDWMVQEYPRIKHPIRPSGRKLVPVSSTEILEKYRQEVKSLQEKVAKGCISKKKAERVLSQLNLLTVELIPRLEKMLGIVGNSAI